jgi:hypothetical protein
MMTHTTGTTVMVFCLVGLLNCHVQRATDTSSPTLAPAGVASANQLGRSPARPPGSAMPATNAGPNPSRGIGACEESEWATEFGTGR